MDSERKGKTMRALRRSIAINRANCCFAPKMVKMQSIQNINKGKQA